MRGKRRVRGMRMGCKDERHKPQGWQETRENRDKGMRGMERLQGYDGQRDARQDG